MSTTKGFVWKVMLAAAIALLSFFLMWYSEGLDYNADTFPRCKNAALSNTACGIQSAADAYGGQTWDACVGSDCYYPKSYDYRPYGFYGALGIALAGFGSMIFLLFKNRKDKHFSKMYWLLIPAIPLSWFGLAMLYFSLHPS